MTTSPLTTDVFVHSDGRRYVVDSSRAPGIIHQVKRVVPLPEHRLWVEFADGAKGEADVSDLAMNSDKVRQMWESRAYFATAHIPDYGGVAWEGELADINPNVLYMKVTGRDLDDIYPQVVFLD